MLGLGTSEILMILAALLLFFGAKQLPQLARGLVQGIREFKDATRDIKSVVDHTTIK
ncbi:hypothetical protein GCM10023189_57270 [Nibrella saemangeumensis]|uniref:Sec-independent protein translocase protein TatA n=1 Tax=Nibrella saemangeumensis TaxID=1084526 RepID=A0ABP8NMQ3_9BACT